MGMHFLSILLCIQTLTNYCGSLSRNTRARDLEVDARKLHSAGYIPTHEDTDRDDEFDGVALDGFLNPERAMASRSKMPRTVSDRLIRSAITRNGDSGFDSSTDEEGQSKILTPISTGTGIDAEGKSESLTPVSAGPDTDAEIDVVSAPSPTFASASTFVSASSPKPQDASGIDNSTTHATAGTPQINDDEEHEHEGEMITLDDEDESTAEDPMAKLSRMLVLASTSTLNTQAASGVDNSTSHATAETLTVNNDEQDEYEGEVISLDEEDENASEDPMDKLSRMLNSRL